MRPAPPETAAAAATISPPSPSPSCDPRVHNCKWWPYSSSHGLGPYAAMIPITLLCAIICALVLNISVRCFLRRNSSEDEDRRRKPNNGPDMASLVVATTVAHTSGMNLGGAETDCAICLSEFVDGEEIQVLGKCNHGFHVSCIRKWLSSHSSCPTCRCNCIASSSSSPPQPADGCSGHGHENITV